MPYRTGTPIRFKGSSTKPACSAGECDRQAADTGFKRKLKAVHTNWANCKRNSKKDGRDVAVEYILAVPAARYGDFADDLKTLHAAQNSTQEWCAETTWQSSRLVVAHDPVRVHRILTNL